jgi:hypothetical protein
MGSFRTPLGRRRKNDGNGSVQQCGDHCECCEIQTTSETYTVSIKNANPGSKVNVGDSVKVYRVDNLNLSSNEKTVVQLERVTNLVIKGLSPRSYNDLQLSVKKELSVIVVRLKLK